MAKADSVARILALSAEGSSGGSGEGTSNYPDLTNLPKLNGKTLVGDTLTSTLGIKTSELVNDDGYLKSTDVIDGLTSTDTSKPLSAKAGKDLQDNKQDKLTAGDGITINDNVVSIDADNQSVVLDYTWPLHQAGGDYQYTEADIFGLTEGETYEVSINGGEYVSVVAKKYRLDGDATSTSIYLSNNDDYIKAWFGEDGYSGQAGDWMLLDNRGQKGYSQTAEAEEVKVSIRKTLPTFGKDLVNGLPIKLYYNTSDSLKQLIDDYGKYGVQIIYSSIFTYWIVVDKDSDGYIKVQSMMDWTSTTAKYTSDSRIRSSVRYGRIGLDEADGKYKILSQYTVYYNTNAYPEYLDTNTDYTTPYEPKYAGSPTTKKYVDNEIVDIMYDKDSLVESGDLAYTKVDETNHWDRAVPVIGVDTVPGQPGYIYGQEYRKWCVSGPEQNTEYITTLDITQGFSSVTMIIDKNDTVATDDEMYFEITNVKGETTRYTETPENNVISLSTGDKIKLYYKRNDKTSLSGTAGYIKMGWDPIANPGRIKLSVLSGGINYETPYEPEYDGSPATKKYVDDAVKNGSTITETDPTVPDYVKAITEEDIARWDSFEGKTIKSINKSDVYLSELEAGIYKVETDCTFHPVDNSSGGSFPLKVGDVISVLSTYDDKTTWIITCRWSNNMYILYGFSTGNSFGYDRLEIPKAASTAGMGYDIITEHNAGTYFLKKNNTTSFTPTGDYNPATKKYVDDVVAGISVDINYATDAEIEAMF